MQALVVWADPSPDSFSKQLCDRTASTLRNAGHVVDVVDLYGSGFDPVMGQAEWQAYRRHEPALDEITAAHAGLVRNAEILIFVYPTRWFGLPAILKGWLERVFVPGVAFSLNPNSNRIEGRLNSLRFLVGISTYPNRRWKLALYGDAGRRTLLRTLRLLCPRSTRSTWISLHDIERRSTEQRTEFLNRVGLALGRIL